MGDQPDRAFRRLFERRARALRSRLTARAMIAGATLGLVAGVGTAALLWRYRLGAWRPAAAALALVGVGGALVWMQRRRWSDLDVALYLDAKLSSDEAIATAIDLDGGDGPVSEGAYAAVVDHAVTALEKPLPKRMWPRIARPWHVLGPAAAGAIVWLSLIALPALPPPPAACAGERAGEAHRAQGARRRDRAERARPP